MLLEPPACLLGGWAVHLHVNPAFSREQGWEYIGSRDIDVGVHVDPEWSSEDLAERAVGSSVARIKDFDYDSCNHCTISSQSQRKEGGTVLRKGEFSS